jgi:uncharacterized membrane protein SirB2
MDYLLVKQLHLGLALISISGFVLRWYWRMHQSQLAFEFATRVIPHVIDTLLLASAVAMIALAGNVPVGVDWLSAKVSGLVLYILLGMIAMHSAPVKSRSLPAFIAAVLVFCWIVSVAVSKSPLGFLRPELLRGSLG